MELVNKADSATVSISTSDSDPVEMDFEEFGEGIEQGTLGLEMVAEVDMNSLVLGKSDIIWRWEQGIWNDLAFIEAALSYDRKESKKKGRCHELSIDLFIGKWCGVTPSGNPKELTREKVLKAIAKLEGIERLQININQLDLEL